MAWVRHFKSTGVQVACSAVGVFGARLDGAQLLAYSGV